MLQSRNPGIMEAVREVKEINLSKWIKARYEERMKDQRDRWAYEDMARDEGRAEGRDEGRAEGRVEGEAMGDLKRSRQSILDLLAELGDVPADITALVCAEKDTEVLRRWLKAAAKATSFDAFRDMMG